MNSSISLCLSMALLMSACMPLRPGQPTDPTVDNLHQLADSRWLLESYGAPGMETPVTDGSSITLAFEGNGQAGGHSGCNSYGGPYLVQNNILKFGEISSTLMMCENPATAVQEQEYLDALRKAERFAITGDSMTIWSDNGNRAINFVRAPVATLAPSPVSSHAPTAGDVPGKDIGARIEFSAGQTSAEVFAEIAAGATDSYYLRGQQGQTLSVEITSPNNDVLLSVVGEDGTPLKHYQNGPPSWTSDLPATQDYDLQAVSVGQATPYTLHVLIEPLAAPGQERVVFEPGKTTATRGGNLATGEVKEYVLTAAAGQRMHVQTVGNSAPVYLTLTSPSGEVTLNNSVGDSWTGEPQASDPHVFAAQVILPETGEYVVRLSGPQGGEATRYEVAFTIDHNPLPTLP